MKVVSKGNDATGNNSPNSCMMCGKVSESMFGCQNCRCGRYCSDVCMNQHKNHTLYCASICDLETLENEKRQKTEIFMSDSEKLPYKLKRNLIRLVGERPLVNVYLNNEITEGLWDTGDMVSLINENYMHQKFPSAKLYSVEEFTGSDSFILTAANQNTLCVTILNFGVKQNQDLFEIPFLVTSEEISNPIIGYNIIEYFVRNYKDKLDVPESLTKIIWSLSVNTAMKMAEIVAKGDQISELNWETKPDRDYVIFPGCVEKVHCKIKNPKVNNPIRLLYFPLLKNLWKERI